MISYTISVYNELSEFIRLMELISKVKKENEEVVVLHTYKDEKEQQLQNFQDIKKIAQSFADIYQTFRFENRFAEMKNYLNSLATKEIIINLDADEFASNETIELWRKIIVQNSSDLYYVPRINTVTGYTLEDIKKYNWQINANGWINWPDYQPRIFKNNTSIQWTGDVHEHIRGFNSQAALPQNAQLAIIHHKTIQKQRDQNTLYTTINNDQQHIRSTSTNTIK